MNELSLNQHSLAHLRFSATWQDATGQHSAIQHVEKFNSWRELDLLPETLAQELSGQRSGHHVLKKFSAGQLVPGWQQEKIVRLPRENFNGRYRSGELIQPRAGRFYPAAMISGINGSFIEKMAPTRFLQQQGDHMLLDVNHPLAANAIAVEVDVIKVLEASAERGGRCNDVINELLNNGPGMQNPPIDYATEIIHPDAFERVDETDDDVFYQTLRKVHHLDANARKSISGLYAKLLPASASVVDLMSSWESHLADDLAFKVTGLGMNRAELEANPQLDGFMLQDLNKQPLLTAENDSFDAVICTASVEYLVQPIQVFKEIRRVLKPGGVCVMTFSNRWFPTKVIKLWTELHEFERMGLVIEYFSQSGWDGTINSLSSRGLQRPQDDPHAVKTGISDPVFAVWSYK